MWSIQKLPISIRWEEIKPIQRRTNTVKEIRHAEIRAQQNESEEMVIMGTPIVFNTPTNINDPRGAYTEVIQRNALDGVDLTDTRLLVSHDYNRIPLAKAPKTM